MAQSASARRLALKNIISSTVQFTREIPGDCSVRVLRKKLEVLEGTFQKCFEAHIDVMERAGDQTREFEETEFVAIQALYETAFDRLTVAAEALDEQDDAGSLASQASTARVVAPVQQLVKLPQISIPMFTGDFNEWVSFRDLFASAIGNRNDLSGAIKLQYLKTYVAGDAAQLVRAYAVTDENYRAAYDVLAARYNNKRLQFNAFMRRLFEQPAVQNESSADIRKLLDTTAEAVQALATLELPTEEWDAVLVYIVVQRLDAESRKTWELSLAENDIPTYDELVEFLERRCRSLEAFASMSSAAAAAALSGDNHHAAPRAQRRAVNHGRVNPFVPCAMCSKNHNIVNCTAFGKLSPVARRDAARDRHLCFVCLTAGHPASSCAVRACVTCSGRHHAMLHFGNTAPTKASAAACSGVVSSSGVSATPTGVGKSSGRQTTSAVSSYCESVASGGAAAGDVSNSSGASASRDCAASTGATSGVVTSGAPSSGATTCDDAKQCASSSGAVVSAVQANFGAGRPLNEVLLATAYAKVGGTDGRVRVLLDSGSQVTLIRESCAQFYGLKRKRVAIDVSGLGSVDAGKSTSMVKLQLRSCVDASQVFDVTALVMGKLTAHLPARRVVKSQRPNFEDLQLADPNYFEPGDIDMILGADICCVMVRDGVRLGSIAPGKEMPTAHNTALGWVVTGPVPIKAAKKPGPGTAAVVNLHLDIERDLRHFWEIEEVGIADLSTEMERQCEAHFLETHTRVNGRYGVRLPFVGDPKMQLGDTRVAAERRLRQLERRLAAKPELRMEYCAFMREYCALGHMQLAPRLEASATAYYVPHHFVVNESSTTTRLRVVFDASCRSTSGKSLNELQMIGPKLQDDLATIVLRFRRHAVALTADIAKMYRQVAVHEDDWDYQRILWRADLAQPIEEWQLKTVTYGMAASSFLAVRALRQLAVDEQLMHQRAAAVVLSDFYVDDLITGCDSSEDAVALQKELSLLMECGGFELRKWGSNCAHTLGAIPEGLRQSTHPLRLDDDAPVKTLGLLWHPAADCFAFKIDLPSDAARVTKRSMLSAVAKLFDPLGLLAPCIIVAKIMIQQLWTAGVDWDEDVPEPLRSTWTGYHATLPALEALMFPRWIGARADAKMQLHGFADASESAYGGVVYMRCEAPDGDVRVTLLTGKTKVAPLQQVSLPRLELCAAVLVTKLMRCVSATYGLQLTECVLWSDSQVALSWIRKPPRAWKTFVANRVAAIQEVVSPERWRHVPTADNPADCLSRGVLPVELPTHDLWLRGPKWLAGCATDWPKEHRSGDTHLDERASAACLVVTTSDGCDDLLQKYSSLAKLKRVTALVSRFIYNCRNSAAIRRQGRVTAAELDDALWLWIRMVQALEFKREVDCCTRGVDVHGQSKLRRLNPFIDDRGVLRLGGRLRNADITDDEAHPVVLPGRSALVSLIVSDAHVQLLHGGTQVMLNYIRQRYWILGARGRIQQHVRSCVTCFRQKPRPAVQQMGDLPRARVTPSRAFSHSGVDYAGPMLYKSRAGRGCRTEKGYVALFVCQATKAVHLEFVSELTTAAFLAAFRRFVARRGKCNELLSDNATNFIGAQRELKNILQSHAHNEEVHRYLAGDGTTWRTIPPRSPHFGGLWEAGVKSVKHHLRRIIGEQLLTFEEFTTMLTEIEAVLNSRPLTALSDDPTDMTALTPGHFLVGGPPVIVPERDYVSVPRNRMTRWQLVSQLVQQLWKRWRTEYLATLQLRTKWVATAPNVQAGQLVVIKDEALPPAKWRMARILSAQSGDDGKVRVVSMRTSSGTTTRAVTQICVLPIEIE